MFNKRFLANTQSPRGFTDTGEASTKADNPWTPKGDLMQKKYTSKPGGGGEKPFTDQRQIKKQNRITEENLTKELQSILKNTTRCKKGRERRGEPRDDSLTPQTRGLWGVMKPGRRSVFGFGWRPSTHQMVGVAAGKKGQGVRNLGLGATS